MYFVGEALKETDGKWHLCTSSRKLSRRVRESDTCILRRESSQGE